MRDSIPLFVTHTLTVRQVFVGRIGLVLCRALSERLCALLPSSSTIDHNVRLQEAMGLDRCVQLQTTIHRRVSVASQQR